MCPLSGVERFPLLGGFQCTNFNGRAIGCLLYRGGPLLGGSVNRGSTVHTLKPIPPKATFQLKLHS